jgi:hypothetical protein
MNKCNFDNDLTVIDTSHNMYTPSYIPFDNACAMGLLLSRYTTGNFKNCVITFSNTPSFVVIDDGPIYNRWRQISKIESDENTNIHKTFQLILSKAKKYNIKPEDMPKRLWIISDTQFDKCSGNSTTNFQEIDKMYMLSGYIRPQIVFWNTNGSNKSFNINFDNNGTALMSGLSSSVIDNVLVSNNNFSPYGIMRSCLDSRRLFKLRCVIENS